MFEKRLNKALSMNLKNNDEIINYCKKEAAKNYSDRKCHDLQCICEYLLYKLNNNVTFYEYQRLQFEGVIKNV